MYWHLHQHVCNPPEGITPMACMKVSGKMQQMHNIHTYIYTEEFLLVHTWNSCSTSSSSVPLWLGGMVHGLQNGISSDHQVGISPLQSTHKSFVIAVTTVCRVLVFRLCIVVLVDVAGELLCCMAALQVSQGLAAAFQHLWWWCLSSSDRQWTVAPHSREPHSRTHRGFPYWSYRGGHSTAVIDAEGNDPIPSHHNSCIIHHILTKVQNTYPLPPNPPSSYGTPNPSDSKRSFFPARAVIQGPAKYYADNNTAATPR